MKKLKLGTRVIVNGIETFISELHADITRGVYKVRTSNPTYEFKQNPNGDWWAGDSIKPIWLEEAPKYGNYQVGDRVFDKYEGVGTVVAISKDATFPIQVDIPDPDSECKAIPVHFYSSDGKTFDGYSKKPVLKKLRVKLGETK